MTDIRAMANRLCPAPVRAVTELDKGGNSRIYRVETAGGAYALKSYPIPAAHDTRNRLQAETQALRFMRSRGIACVPDMVAADPKAMFGLLSWCDGEPIDAVRDSDIEAFAAFLCQLADISGEPEAQALAPASEACTAAATILTHIDKRLQRLHAPAQSNASLNGFLQRTLQPFLQQHVDAAQSAYRQHALAFDRDIERRFQVLIPSDFGSHNALRAGDGLCFLDFEYFGWDDPVTSTANFLLHPAMTLSDAQKRLFADRMEEYFRARDPLYAMRMQALLPLYAARWAMIILGEFIPEHWQHRVRSGKYREDEKEHVQAGQLAKAETVLQSAELLAVAA